MNAKGRRLTAEDLLDFTMVSDPQLSPDGTRVAWVKTWMDRTTNSNKTQIQLTDVDTGKTRPLMTTTGNHHPRWSPDGQYIAFLAPGRKTRNPDAPDPAVSIFGGAQLMVVSANGGEIWQLTDLLTGAGPANWSPDGQQIAFTTRVKPQEGLRFTTDQSPSSADPYAYFNQDVLVVNRIAWKSDASGFLGDYRQQVACAPFNPTQWGENVQPRLLTLGDYDLSAPTWSPDGKQLAAVGNIDLDNERVGDKHLYLISLEGDTPAHPTKVFGLKAMSTDLAWSPDGAGIVVSGHDDPEVGNAGVPKLWWITPETHEGVCITEELEHPLGDYSRNNDLRGYDGMHHGDDIPKWIDGNHLLALVNIAGTVHLHRLSRETGKIQALTEGNMTICAFSVDAKAKRAVVLMEDDMKPSDLYLLDLTEPAPLALTPLTQVNADLLSELNLTEPERFEVPSDDVTIDTWLLPPVDREPGKRYPVILYTGGGPGGMRASVFVHEFHLYAAHGYAVLHCNARGNYGYGEAFATAPKGAWGKMDRIDNIRALRYACEQYDYLDADRLGVAGGSYGGYMASTITAHHPEFKAAVVDRCVCNNYSSHGTGDIGYLLNLAKYDNKHPWEAPMEYLENSPIQHVDKIKTPTLIVHSALDYRCPVEQGEQLYSALQLVGVPTRLVRFPNENHGLSRGGRPWHRVFRLHHYLDWFKAWL